jgi:hypothetical protein
MMCIPIASKRVGNHIRATYVHATIDGLPLLSNGAVNTVFSVGSVQRGYKKCLAGAEKSNAGSAQWRPDVSNGILK